nr:thermonuclease family protein [Mesorhizobium sp. Root554]
MADIDAPEKDAPCAFERRLAQHATEGLIRLLQQPFKITRTGKDRFGRTLALVWVNGRDVGATLVDAGLARQWIGRKEHWCSGRTQ